MDSGLRNDLMSEVDDVWSELLRHLPLNDGRQDQTRESVEFTAVLRTGDRDADPMKFGRGSKASAGVAADGGHLRIDRSVHANLVIRKGDKVVAIGRSGEPVFEVLSVDDRSHLRLLCELGDS